MVNYHIKYIFYDDIYFNRLFGAYNSIFEILVAITIRLLYINLVTSFVTNLWLNYFGDFFSHNLQLNYLDKGMTKLHFSNSVIW